MHWIIVFNLNTMLLYCRAAVSINPQGFIGKHDWIRLTVLNFDYYVTLIRSRFRALKVHIAYFQVTAEIYTVVNTIALNCAAMQEQGKRQAPERRGTLRRRNLTSRWAGDGASSLGDRTGGKSRSVTLHII
jgi:hypothetical protein